MRAVLDWYHRAARAGRAPPSARRWRTSRSSDSTRRRCRACTSACASCRPSCARPGSPRPALALSLFLPWYQTATSSRGRRASSHSQPERVRRLLVRRGGGAAGRRPPCCSWSGRAASARRFHLPGGDGLGDHRSPADGRCCCSSGGCSTSRTSTNRAARSASSGASFVALAGGGRADRGGCARARRAPAGAAEPGRGPDWEAAAPRPRTRGRDRAPSDTAAVTEVLRDRPTGRASRPRRRPLASRRTDPSEADPGRGAEEHGDRSDTLSDRRRRTGRAPRLVGAADLGAASVRRLRRSWPSPPTDRGGGPGRRAASTPTRRLGADGATRAAGDGGPFSAQHAARGVTRTARCSIAAQASSRSRAAIRCTRVGADGGTLACLGRPRRSAGRGVRFGAIDGPAVRTSHASHRARCRAPRSPPTLAATPRSPGSGPRGRHGPRLRRGAPPGHGFTAPRRLASGRSRRRRGGRARGDTLVAWDDRRRDPDALPGPLAAGFRATARSARTTPTSPSCAPPSRRRARRRGLGAQFPREGCCPGDRVVVAARDRRRDADSSGCTARFVATAPGTRGCGGLAAIGDSSCAVGDRMARARQACAPHAEADALGPVARQRTTAGPRDLATGPAAAGRRGWDRRVGAPRPLDRAAIARRRGRAARGARGRCAAGLTRARARRLRGRAPGPRSTGRPRAARSSRRPTSGRPRRRPRSPGTPERSRRRRWPATCRGGRRRPIRKPAPSGPRTASARVSHAG